MAANIEALKEEMGMRKLQEVNGFKPVLVKTQYEKNMFSFGVQFWSEFLINSGKSRNSDGTLAILIEVL